MLEGTFYMQIIFFSFFESEFYVAQIGLDLDLPVSTSLVLELKA